MAGGRPTVVTEEVLRKLEEAFSYGCTDLEACLHANIGKSTLYDYQEANPAFAERKQELKENIKLHARLNLSHSILNEKSVDDSKWYLERKCKNEFSTKVENEHTGADGNPIQHSLVVEYLDVKE